jgi:hypothetical protein
MESMETQPIRPAVFAAEGTARNWLVRAALVGGAGLLVGWVVALALGAFGGFETLPGLPDKSPSTQVSGDSDSSSAPAPTAKQDAATQSVQPSAAENPRRSTTHQAPARTKPVRTKSPSPSSTTTTHGKANSQGQGIGTTKPTGKPVGSPGNGPGGSGAPGQLD